MSRCFKVACNFVNKPTKTFAACCKFFNKSMFNEYNNDWGPMVKRLRHRPFTAVSRVQIPVGSPHGSIAQLGEHLPYKQGVTGSSPVTSTIIFLILGCFNYGLVVQLVRMPPCHGGGRGFESHLSRHLDFNRDPMCWCSSIGRAIDL